MMVLERFNAKGTDILSALMLLIAAILAGSYGSLTPQHQSVPTTQQHSSLADTGTGGHRSAPVLLKQNLLAIEARDAKTASGDDGKAKPFLASKGVDLSSTAFREIPAAQPVTALSNPEASFFDARAPPANA